MPIAKKRIIIVNRNYPPRMGVTGESACRLAAYLESQQNVEVFVVTALSKYAGGGSQLAPQGTVRMIRSWYDGKNKILRLLSSFFVSLFLIRTARTIKSDHVIVMTDPPFLQFWASVLLRGKQPWTLWAMDIFPNAFVAGNLVSEKNIVYRFLKRIVYQNAPDSMIALGPLQAEYLRNQYQKPIPKTAIIPCGVSKKDDNTSVGASCLATAGYDCSPDWRRENQEKIILGYCGNLGEAHSVEFLEQVIENLDDAKFHLVLAVYGVNAEKVLRCAKKRSSGVTILKNIDRTHLHHIDIHLVSLLQRWAHICVPSKAVSAICSGSAILFYGTQHCDNWKLLSEAGWLITETEDTENLSTNIRGFFTKVSKKGVELRKSKAIQIGEQLQKMVDKGYLQVAQNILGTEAYSEPISPSPVLPSVAAMPASDLGQPSVPQ